MRAGAWAWNGRTARGWWREESNRGGFWRENGGGFGGRRGAARARVLDCLVLGLAEGRGGGLLFMGQAVFCGWAGLSSDFLGLDDS
jgi:hypothetical protein